MGDHTETFQIDYDPARITYDEILEIFWAGHNPAARGWSRQYMAIVFYHDEAQKEAAQASKAAVEAELNATVYTEILPFTRFYMAEDYHQKYYLQAVPDLKAEIRAYYPAFDHFTNSPTAARLNGYAAGYASAALLEKEQDLYGLSSRGKELLQRLAR